MKIREVKEAIAELSRAGGYSAIMIQEEIKSRYGCVIEIKTINEIQKANPHVADAKYDKGVADIINDWKK